MPQFKPGEPHITGSLEELVLNWLSRKPEETPLVLPYAVPGGGLETVTYYPTQHGEGMRGWCWAVCITLKLGAPSTQWFYGPIQAWPKQWWQR